MRVAINYGGGHVAVDTRDDEVRMFVCRQLKRIAELRDCEPEEKASLVATLLAREMRRKFAKHGRPVSSAHDSSAKTYVLEA